MNVMEKIKYDLEEYKKTIDEASVARQNNEFWDWIEDLIERIIGEIENLPGWARFILSITPALGRLIRKILAQLKVLQVGMATLKNKYGKG